MKRGRPANVALNGAIERAVLERRAIDPARTSHSIAQEVAGLMAEARAIRFPAGHSREADVKRALRILKRATP